MKSFAFRGRAGFTLIELLLVIGIIAILASIVIVAINPTKQLADARNAQRRSDVNTVINAIYQYAIDEDGNLPGCLPTATADTAYGICVSDDCGTYDADVDGVTGSNAPAAGCELAADLEGTYLVGLPLDPQGVPSNTLDYTGYTVEVSSENRIEVVATEAEQGETISVTR